MPNVLPVGEVIAKITPKVANRFGLTSDTVICAGTIDSVAAFLAGAPLEEGVAVTSLGSTLAVKMLVRKRVDEPEIGLYAHRISDYWLVGGASNTGGAVLLKYFTPDEMTALSALIDPYKHTYLSYYPLLTLGERFPINDPALAPNVTPRPPEDHLLLQGMFEGIAEIESRCYTAIADRAGITPSRIFSAGGGASNHVWTKIRSKIL